MSKPSTPEQKVDHRGRSEELLRWLGDPIEPRSPEDPRLPLVNLAAQVHSNLAIAEELRGIREALEGVVWTNQIPAGGTDRKLRVTHE